MNVEFAKVASGQSVFGQPGQANSDYPQLLVPLMTTAQQREYLTWCTVWIVALVSFWIWWLKPEHIITSWGFLLCSSVLAWVTLLPLYFIFIVVRSRAPAATVAIPSGYRVAMVVTKVPSEPFSLVQLTLEAMLRQGYPHDTWLADEDPSEETIEWCRQNGIKISTRKGCADYHRADWPRRARCKEGNLSYFYDHYGYEHYDFVVQLDADHVPSMGYLEEMLRPFVDPTVGYVSAPSICDKNAHQSWSARGRLYIEGALHGALQAGYNGGLAPLCIGSHYAVRTVALRRVGGLGPELAEDHSTTLMLNAHGWRGVHAVNAIARGDGPQAFSDLVTQEFQWSRSLLTILIRYTPKYIKKLPTRLRFQFLFSQLWYALFATTFLTMYLIPIIALCLDQVLVNIKYPYFFIYANALAAILVIISLRLKGFGVLRPYGVKVLSWEGFLFLFARWPWSLIGTICAVCDQLRHSNVNFSVTPKGNKDVALLPFRFLAPYVVLSVVSGIAVILLEAQSATGYYFFALLNCVIYAVVLLAILIRHNLEGGNAWLSIETPTQLLSIRALVVATVIVIPIIGLSRIPAALNSLLWIG